MSKPGTDQSPQTPWYDTAFGGDYLEVYAHRNQAAARTEVAFILEHSPAQAHPRILDIACGAGRHLFWLAEKAQLAVGIDRSAELLAKASKALPSKTHLVRADMRNLPFAAQFTCATLLFTSFGYFPTDPENLAVILQAATVLEPGGVFWLDYLNEPHLRRTLQPHSRDTKGDCTIEQYRRITPDGRVEKKIHIISPQGERWAEESVKLYSRPQIQAMFARAELTVSGIWGDFQGRAHSPDSPRLIITGRKNG